MNACSTGRQDAGYFSGNSPLAAIRREFERHLGVVSAGELGAMTVTELSDRWIVDLDLPGVSESDVNVTFEDGSLVIEGQRKAVVHEGGKGLFNDRSFGSFRRVLNVRDAIDRNAIEANMADGVLTLVLNRSLEATPRKISIRKANPAN